MLSVYDDEQYLFQARCASARRVTAEEHQQRRVGAPTGSCMAREPLSTGGWRPGPPTPRRGCSATNLARGAAGLTQREERNPVLCGQRPVQPRHRDQAGDRRRNRQEPPAVDLPQARRQRPRRSGRHRPGKASTNEAHPGSRASKVRDLVDADRELALLPLIQSAFQRAGRRTAGRRGGADDHRPGTASDVCFVHVLDDSDRSLTLAGATPRSTARSARSGCRWVRIWMGGQRRRGDQRRQGVDPPLHAVPVTARLGFHVDGVGPDGDRPRRAGRRAQRAPSSDAGFTEQDVELLVIGRLIAGARTWPATASWWPANARTRTSSSR